MIDPHKITTLHAIRDAHPGTGGTVQCDRIRAALAVYPVTTFEAMRHLDVYDPRARVLQLRRAGVDIDTHWQNVDTEAGETHRVGVYVLRPGSPCHGSGQGATP
jgi:hypothetical protein